MRRVLALAVFLLCMPAVRATVLVPASFQEIVSGSDVIVYGRVIALDPEWSADRHTINTLATIQAGTYLKGGPGETVTVRVPGGTIGRYRNVMVGAPELHEGDEAVFFLRGASPRIGTIFGLSQGLFRVREEQATGRRMVLPAPLPRSGEPEPVVRGAADRRLVPLDDFARQVRSAIAQGAAR